MKIREIMTPRAESIAPDASVKEAAERMRALDVGILPVCENDRLVGMITDRDITVRSVSEGHVERDQVRDIMTPDVFYCLEDADVTEAAQIMREKQVRRLPVLNQEHRLVGIIALSDLAVEGGDEQLTGRVLEGISERMFLH